MSLLLLFSCSENIQEEYTSPGYTFYEKAASYISTHHADSAFLMFEEARNIFMEENDSLNVANSLLRMGIIQRDQGDYFGAQETSLQAIDYLDQPDPDHRVYMSSVYNNLAMATSSLGDYERAIGFYENAYNFSDSSAHTYLILNNLAISYRQNRNYDKAFEIFQDIIQKTHQSNPIIYARVRSNYAMAKLQQDSAFYAAPELMDALYIRGNENDLNGLNASYAHLSDYYARHNLDSAILYANRQYEVANRIKNPDSRLRALDRLIKLSPAGYSKLYYEEYKQLSDSVQLARAAAKNQFALIRYEVEKNKAENLRLEKVNTEKASRLSQQRTMTGCIALLFIGVISGGIFYYKKRKQRLELEAQDRIKAGMLKTSRKVHDVVANGIYRVLAEIEYKEDIDREDILDKLEDMYHKSRDISYETNELLAWSKPYHEILAELIKSFANSTREVFIVGNESGIWDFLQDEGREHIRQVLQELMVNMDKHSRATNVVVRFEKSAEALTISYSDDGMGLKKESAHGHGLSNTVSRIKSLGGKITFVERQEKGLKVEIMLPVKKG